MERFNLLDLRYIMIQRWGKVYGSGFPLRSWQEGFLKGAKDHFKMPWGYLKDFSKEIPQVKAFGFESK